MTPRWLVRLAGAAIVAVLLAPAPLWYWRLHPAHVPITDDPGRHGLAFDSLEFTAADGARLRGWYLRAPTSTGSAVVIAPGIDNNRLQSGVTLGIAPTLLDAGFDVIAFDLRGEGESAGEPITFGIRERLDVLAAVGQVRDRGATRVGVLGFSLGGVAAILAAADSDTIDALVIDSAFADLTETLRNGLKSSFGLPDPVVAYGLAVYPIVSGTDPSDVSPVRAIGAIPPRPILIIHGTADTAVPISDSDRLAAAGQAPATRRWIVTGGTHALSYLVDPEAYRARIVSFFTSALR